MSASQWNSDQAAGEAAMRQYDALRGAAPQLLRALIGMIYRLQLCDPGLPWDGVDGPDPLNEAEAAIRQALSGRPNDGRSGRCGVRVGSGVWCVLDVGHRGRHV